MIKWMCENPGYTCIIAIFAFCACEAIFKPRYCSCCKKPLNQDEADD